VNNPPKPAAKIQVFNGKTAIINILLMNENKF
jgi:hypothetical protein